MMRVWFLSFFIYLHSASGAGANIDFDNKLLQAYQNALGTRAVSATCQDAIDLLIENLQSPNDTWALQMLDASSKIPVGIFSLNQGEMGQFSECLATESEDGLIRGKYCLGQLNISLGSTAALVEQRRRAYQIRKMARAIINLEDDDDDDGAAGSPLLQLGIPWAICIPSQCTAADVKEVLGDLIADGSVRCQTKDDLNLPLTNGAIATIVILSVIAFLLVASTALDLYYRFISKVSPPPILITFSVYTNGERLFKISKNSNELTCLNGIRFISMLWVIIGHLYGNYASSPVFNFMDLWKWLNKLRSMNIVSGTLSVDSFFFMSGLLLVYGYMKAKHQGIKFNIFMFYVHRYLRLTPALAAAVLVAANLFKYTGTGPKWYNINTLEESCQKYWWTTLLYVQNYVNDTHYCLSQTWYLSVDMQLYVITPLVLLPLKYPKIGVGIIITTIVAFIIVPFTIAYITEIPALISNFNARVPAGDFMRYYYDKTHARAAPWFMGVLFGYILTKLQFRGALKHITLNKFLVIFLWAVCIAVGLTCIYAGHDSLRGPDYNIWASSLHLALVRPTWALCLAWVIFACISGYGGPINWLLSFPIYQVLNRFTYSIYLIHYPVLAILAYSAKTAVYFDEISVAYSFWGVTMFSFFISVIWVLAFESPITALEKIIFSSPKKVSKPAENGEKTGLPA